MFALPKTEHVLAAVHDLAGRCVRTLADARFAPGSHRMTWDGRDADGRVVAAGVYFVRLEVAGVAQSRRIVRLP
jgi:flagellar hook assembly protein FlgD